MMEISKMNIEDYEEIISLWQSIEGVVIHDDSDSKTITKLYLQRNPGLSFVAHDNGKLVGAVLCGHEGRRGYLNHLAVAKNYRNCGIGTALVDKVIDKLRMIGIRKCIGFVLVDNTDGSGFWKHLGWSEQEDLKVFSKSITL